MSHERLCLPYWTIIICLPAFIKGVCLDGDQASFVMTTNARFESPTSEVEDVLLVRNDVNMTSCVILCLNDIRCKSINYYQSSSGSACESYASIAEGDSLVYQRKSSAISVSYYLEKICLKGCSRLFTFESIQGMLLDDFDDKIVEDVDRVSCLQACAAESNFRCRSVGWDELDRICRLSRFDRFNRNNYFKSTKASTFYFDNNCGYDPGNISTIPEVLSLGNVYHPYSIVEQNGGISVTDCAELCIGSSQIPCRSFLHGERNRTEYCGLTHQNRVGFLRTPASFIQTDSIGYYEIAPSLELCDESDVSMELSSGIYLDSLHYKQIDSLSPGECIALCKSESRCKSLNIDYDAGMCKLLEGKVFPGIDDRLKTSQNYNYFEKTCVYESTECGDHWSFERVKGKTLVGVNTRLVVRANTKEECKYSCLSAVDFVCRSAEYNYELNECKLSTHNRFSTKDKFVLLEDSKQLVDYFESSCYKEARGFCNTKKTAQRAQILADEIKQTLSLETCRQACFESKGFACRSYTFDFTSRICQLSHHTKKSLPKDSLRPVTTTDYYDVDTCFEVSVNCESDRMLANVKSNKVFRGRLYSKNKPKTCQVDISQSTDFTLPIALEGSDCGTVSEEEGVFSNIIVIQANDYIVTSVDKAIGLKCSYHVGNKTEQAALSFNITELDADDTARGAPEAPLLSMRIVDSNGRETETVSLGDLLRVQVLMDDESTYGIFLRNMVARSAVDNSELTLINDIGCPVEVKMMKEVRKVDGGRKALESYMEAFSFTGSNLVEIETEVETCINNCKPVTCQILSGRSENKHSVLSFGKKKRSLRAEDSKSGSVISKAVLKKTVSVVSPQFGVKSVNSYKENPPMGVKERKPVKLRMNEENKLFCMEPKMAAAIGIALLLVQGLSVAICIACICRRISRKPKSTSNPKNSIYYDNCELDLKCPF